MTRLLVVDDSPLMRRLIASAFEGADDFELAFARDGSEALQAVGEFRPDVVTLDVEMPGLDGLACLDRIMVEAPCRVVMVSALTAEGAETTLKALDLGAVDFVEKPQGAVSLAMEAFGPKLVETVRAAAGARLPTALRLAERVRLRAGIQAGARRRRSVQRPGEAPIAAPARPTFPIAGASEGIVLVGCSTGGPPALEILLAGLPAELAWPVVIAQHMPASFTGALARRLDKLCGLSVQEVHQPTPLEPGSAYVGRGDADVVVSRRGERLVALPAPALPEGRWRPSVDRLVLSALTAVPARRLVGVLMTGMGDDGARAMARLKQEGGAALAEAEETAVVWGMPGVLVRSGGASAVAPVDALAELVAAEVARR